MTPLCDTHLIEPLANQRRSAIASCTLETTTTHIPSSAQRRPVGTFKFWGDRREWRPSRRRRSAKNGTTTASVWCRVLNRQHSSHPEGASGSLVMHKSDNVITSHFGNASKALEIHTTGEPTCSSSLTSASETTVGAVPFLFPDFTSDIHSSFNLVCLPLPSHSGSKTSEGSEYLLETA